MLADYFLHIEFFILCLVSVGLGALVGVEREYRNKPAGLKTHVMICLGATALTYLSVKLSFNGDPGRIAAQIVSGIGFIGAGTILQSRKVIQGLTTAATLWVVASIGMLVGAGLVVPATAMTGLVVVVLVFSNVLSKTKYSRQHYSLHIDISRVGALEKIDDMVQKFELQVDHRSVVKEDGIRMELHYNASPVTQHLFLKALFQLKGVGTVLKY